jgi:hypothetical protein
MKMQLAIFMIYYWAIRDTNVHSYVTVTRNSDQFFSMHDLPIVSPSKAPTSTREIGGYTETGVYTSATREVLDSLYTNLTSK